MGVGVAEGLPVAEPVAAPQRAIAGPTLSDEFTAMARRIPGGFGGIYFDRDGVFTILLVDPTREEEARAMLVREPFIQARAEEPGGEKFDPQSARIAAGRWAHDQLHEWYHRLLANLPVAPTMSGVSVHRNRIVMGFATAEQRLEVLRAIPSAAVPPDAVIVEVTPPVVTLQQTLYDRIRPVPGGVQTRFNVGGEPWCTIGPNALRLEQRAFLVCSHCTRDLFTVDWNNITHYWQPVITGGTGNHIGNEAIDPPLFQCDEDPDGCRNSDAALALYASYAPYELGYIARPAGRNTGTLNIDATNPRFQIIGIFNWAVDGETLEKVGRTTGWTGGTVADGCITLEADYGRSIRCSMIVDAEAGSGDSGSPVFKITAGTQVRLRGTLWGGRGTCHYAPDPVYQDQTALYCSQFVASNLGGIQNGLNPDGNAPLTWR